jgi:flagellar biosynthetic protein FliO
VNDQKKKKTAVMFAVVIVAGGLIGFAARATDREKAVAPVPQTQRTLFDDPNFAQPGAEKAGNLGSKELFFKMMLSVLLVAGLAIGALYLSKKVLPNLTRACGKEIRVVETTYLGPRKALHLVEIGNQRLLIGSTNESIAALAHVGDTWLDLPMQEIDNSVSA